jgi:hypothetical protein
MTRIGSRSGCGVRCLSVSGTQGKTVVLPLAVASNHQHGSESVLPRGPGPRLPAASSGTSELEVAFFNGHGEYD